MIKWLSGDLAGRMVLAKGRGGRKREAKKPKADKKPVPVTSTFLRPQPAGPRTKEAGTDK
jgi:hypothetical protein